MIVESTGTLPGDPVVLEVSGEHVHLGVQRDHLGPEGLVLTQYLLKILLQVVTPTARLKIYYRLSF
jgi:hypothetical protein